LRPFTPQPKPRTPSKESFNQRRLSNER
jgi:hypothetical protein